MSYLYWLTNGQMARLMPFFPRSQGKPRVDDRRVQSSISSLTATACDGVRWDTATCDIWRSG